jgi:Orn/Lys/Arg decarboxylase, major domain
VSTPPDQTQTPYASAVAGYADQDWLRLDVPGHQAWSGRESLLTTYFGRRLLELDLPPLVDGIDYGDRPTPLGQSARLAASAWGARKTYFLTNGGSKGNLVSCIALRSIGEQVLVQRSVHSLVIDGSSHPRTIHWDNGFRIPAPRSASGPDGSLRTYLDSTHENQEQSRPGKGTRMLSQFSRGAPDRRPLPPATTRGR